MTVASLITDIIRTLPLEVFSKHGEPGILSILNRRYKNLNREFKCLEKQYSLTEAANVSLPADWIEPFSADNEFLKNKTFVDPGLFDEDIADIWTIKNKKLYFGNAGTTTIVFEYYSTGLDLVRSVTDSGTESASPEWLDESLHSILYYAAIIDTWGRANPDFAMALSEFERLKNELDKSTWDKQAIQPPTLWPAAGAPMSRYIDDYERPHTIER